MENKDSAELKNLKAQVKLLNDINANHRSVNYRISNILSNMVRDHLNNRDHKDDEVIFKMETFKKIHDIVINVANQERWEYLDEIKSTIEENKIKQEILNHLR